jgi:two-component system response regulator BaeR
MSTLILIVEDEEKLAGLLQDYLRQAEFQTHIIDNGLEVAVWVRQHQPALVLLDLMLPGKFGMEVCKELRAFSEVPIIMMTARVDEIDRLLGLELGADDYICKPYSPREVVARVKAVLRRRPQQAGELVDASAVLVLDEERYKARLLDQDLDLTAIEFQLLKVLASDPGRIFSRNQLIDRTYSDHRVVSDRTIDSHIKKLRRKILASVPGEDCIHSVYGVGYKFERKQAQ